LEDWDLIVDQVIDRRYPLAGYPGQEMAIRWTACDSGGKAGSTERAYNFYRKLKSIGKHRNFMLVKGASSNDVPRLRKSYPDSERKDRSAGARGEIPVYILNTTVLKDKLNNDLDIESPGRDYIHFPDWLEDWFLGCNRQVLPTHLKRLRIAYRQICRLPQLARSK